MVTANAQQLWLWHVLRANSVQGRAGDRRVCIVKPQGGGGGTHSPVSAVIHFLASLHIHPCQSVRGQRLQAKGCGASQGAGYSSLWLSHLLQSSGMQLAKDVNKERQACEKDVRFLKPRSMSVYPRREQNMEEMGLFPGQLLWMLTCGEEIMRDAPELNCYLQPNVC